MATKKKKENPKLGIAKRKALEKDTGGKQYELKMMADINKKQKKCR